MPEATLAHGSRPEDGTLRSLLEPWVEYFESSSWATLRFDLEGVSLVPYSTAVLDWSDVLDLEVGALLVLEEENGISCILKVGLDESGNGIWVRAFGVDRPGLWRALEKQLREPLPYGTESSEYYESLMVAPLTSQRRERRFFFGYARCFLQTSAR